MASDRMKQAIDALERAIDRLEQNLDGLDLSASPSSSSGVDAAAARAALRSLDALIGELKESAHG
ncbi:hypothetical protein [Sphingobium cloacae]|uniref:hypothetical protein n=1 Tax=Sphingobium cloacae TaxID=120107 RepID=UPI001E60A995|nr:hypothetical protein [Sphingobium cloacae]